MADDVEGIRKFFEKVLTGEGYMVTCACDGDEAVAHPASPEVVAELKEKAIPHQSSPEVVADRVRQHMTHQDCPGGSYLRRDAGHKSACTHSSN